MALKSTLLEAGKEGLSEYNPVVSKPINEVNTAKTSKKSKTDEATAKNKESVKSAPIEAKKTTKKMPGRPSKDPTIKKTVYISEDNMANLKAPLLMNNGNLSQYINVLIEKDIKEHKSIYDQMISLTNIG